MLVRFVTENFLSFNDEVEFSMIAGKGRTLNKHIIKANGRNDIKLLRAGVIYGANASGKSNIIKAMAFAKNLIVNGTKPNKSIPVNPFRLDKESLNKPSKFQFDIKHNGCIYSYGFTLNSNKIISEWLYEIDKVKEKLIFERETLENNEVKIKFGNIKTEDSQFLDFVARGTRKNQLFLTESADRNIKNVKEFTNVYEWFYEVVNFIFPDSKYAHLVHQIKTDGTISDFLSLFDTGIIKLEPIEVDINKIVNDFPEEFKSKFLDILPEIKNDTKGILNTDNVIYGYSKNENGNLNMFKLMAKHKSKDPSNEVLFELNEESDGTQRLMDIIPILISMTLTSQVFIIDELDRSLHPLLISKFLDLYFKMKEINERNNQIIFTTHSSNLLDLDLLRKDEIWFIEKNNFGESSVYSLEEYNPRYDKDIRRGYLSGRFGAIPIIGSNLVS